MDKWRFKELLKKAGYSVEENNPIPTVLVVGLNKKEFIKKRMEIIALARKAGYQHSFGVKNLEEEIQNGDKEVQGVSVPSVGSGTEEV
jgi:hypothetical protein